VNSVTGDCIAAFNFIAQLSTPVKLALCSLSVQHSTHRPRAPQWHTHGLALIGAVASAGGSGDAVNLSFRLNRDALCGVVDNWRLIFSCVGNLSPLLHLLHSNSKYCSPYYRTHAHAWTAIICRRHGVAVRKKTGQAGLAGCPAGPGRQASRPVQTSTVVRVSGVCLNPSCSLANWGSCATPAKSEGIEYLQVGPTEIRYSIAWTIFVYL